jgi:hypothetical protein
VVRTTRPSYGSWLGTGWAAVATRSPNALVSVEVSRGHAIRTVTAQFRRSKWCCNAHRKGCCAAAETGGCPAAAQRRRTEGGGARRSLCVGLPVRSNQFLNQVACVLNVSLSRVYLTIYHLNDLAPAPSQGANCTQSDCSGTRRTQYTAAEPNRPTACRRERGQFDVGDAALRSDH